MAVLALEPVFRLRPLWVARVTGWGNRRRLAGVARR